MTAPRPALWKPLLFLALSGGLAAQETIIRHVFDTRTDTHVEVLALFSEPAHSGFLPVRVTVANNLANERAVRLRFSSRAGYGAGLNSTAVYDFSAPAGQGVTRDVLVPLAPQPGGRNDSQNVNVILSGSLGNAQNTLSTGSSPSRPAVLLSESLFTPNASALDAAVSAGGSSSRYGSSRFAAKFDPKQLPSEWLAFSGHDFILMTDADWSATPPGARGAIHSWVVLGGNLLVFAETDVSPAALGIPAATGYGKVEVISIPGLPALDAKATVDIVDRFPANRNRMTSLNSDYEGSWPLQARFGVREFRYGLFIFVLILFAVLVGPVNLFYFAKAGRRHRLFFTTPLISLGASLLLVALIIFQDGFGGSGVRRVLMEVVAEGGSNAAHLHQEQISRSGILAGSRFTVDPACLISPVPIAKSRWARYTNHYETSGRFDLQPAAGKLLATGDWWQSRSEHGHSLSAVVPTRGRIERGPNGGQLVSTFDFPLRVLYYLDEAGQWHRSENIGTGKPFALVPVEAAMVAAEIAAEANAFGRRHRQALETAAKRRDHFVAVTDQAPAIETLPGIRWKETVTVITGPVAAGR